MHNILQIWTYEILKITVIKLQYELIFNELYTLFMFFKYFQLYLRV